MEIKLLEECEIESIKEIFEEEGDKVWVRKEKSNCLERTYFVE